MSLVDWLKGFNVTKNTKVTHFIYGNYKVKLSYRTEHIVAEENWRVMLGDRTRFGMDLDDVNANVGHLEIYSEFVKDYRSAYWDLTEDDIKDVITGLRSGDIEFAKTILNKVDRTKNNTIKCELSTFNGKNFTLLQPIKLNVKVESIVCLLSKIEKLVTNGREKDILSSLQDVRIEVSDSDLMTAKFVGESGSFVTCILL